MEPQTTPASPPKKVRRIGSATSLEEVPVVPCECLEKASDDDEFPSSNGEEKTVLPAKSTKSFTRAIASTSRKSEENAQFWESSVAVETNKNYSITDYISSQDEEGEVSGPEDEEGKVSSPEDEDGGIPRPEFEEDGISIPEDKEDEVSVSEVDAQSVIDSEVNQDETDAANSELTRDKLNVDSPREDLDIILDSFGCNEKKSKDKLLEEYFNNPASRQLTESFFRSALQTYLISHGEVVYNSSSSTELMNTINVADFLTIIKVFAGLLKQNEVQLNPSMQGESEQLAGNPSAEIVAQSGLPKKLYSTQGTQTDEPNQMNDEANVGTFIDEMYELHLNKVTASLITDMRAEMHDANDKKNISATGKVLLKVFFTDEEIFDGFLRKQCKKDGTQTQAYDVKRVFIMSQVINFMITENEDISVSKFKETTNKNKGLQGKNHEYFVKGVMVEYANYLRKTMKLAKEAVSSSAAATV